MSRIYDVTYDSKQNMVLVPKKGKENYIENKKALQTQIKAKNSELEQVQLELEDMGTEGDSWWETTDGPKKEALIARIEELNQQKEALLKSTNKKTQAPIKGETSPLDDIYNS